MTGVNVRANNLPSVNSLYVSPRRPKSLVTFRHLKFKVAPSPLKQLKPFLHRQNPSHHGAYSVVRMSTTWMTARAFSTRIMKIEDKSSSRRVCALDVFVRVTSPTTAAQDAPAITVVSDIHRACILTVPLRLRKKELATPH